VIKQNKPIEMEIDKIKLNPDNARVLRRRAELGLESSLEELGNLGVIVVNKRTGNLVSGEQRLKIMKREGAKTTYGYEIDVPKEKELAVMLAMNNKNITGDDKPGDQIKNIEKIAKALPDIYDKLQLVDLKRQLQAMKPAPLSFEAEERIPDMEIQPYEHYDYIVIMCKDVRGWLSLLDIFGIKKTKVKLERRKAKVGLGRVIDGGLVLKKIFHKESAVSKEEKDG